jgi:hypothetical protein
MKHYMKYIHEDLPLALFHKSISSLGSVEVSNGIYLNQRGTKEVKTEPKMLTPVSASSQAAERAKKVITLKW